MIWNRLARLLSKPAIANWLIRRAMKHPYLHLPSNQDPSYMARYWLFNPYDRVTNKPRWFFCPWSIRIHHIKREDYDRALHDHPWNARTIILKGWYTEKRLLAADDPAVVQLLASLPYKPQGQFEATEIKLRQPGDTAKLGFGEYHTITDVHDDGAWTMFISGPWQGVWGFLVNGAKIPWREYLGIPAKGDLDDAKPANKGPVPLGSDRIDWTEGDRHLQYKCDTYTPVIIDPVDARANLQAIEERLSPAQRASLDYWRAYMDQDAEYCGTCKGYGKYQDGDSGTEADGYAPNIVECDCADSERMPQFRRTASAARLRASLLEMGIDPDQAGPGQYSTLRHVMTVKGQDQ